MLTNMYIGRYVQVEGELVCVENPRSSSVATILDSALATDGNHSFGWGVKHFIKISLLFWSFIYFLKGYDSYGNDN